MLIKPEMTHALNEQIGHEFGASLQYLAIASYFDNDNLPVLAKFFYRQADEERDHAMRILRYVVDASGQLAIPAIPAPKSDFGSAEEAVRSALDWEITVTGQINQLVDLAVEHGDHLSKQFLDWFVNEQLEEVSTMETLLGMVRRAGESGLLTVEQLLAQQGGVGSAEAEADAT